MKIPGSHCVERWVGPRAGLDGWGKSQPPPEFDHRTVHPVASRYTDLKIAPHLNAMYGSLISDILPVRVQDTVVYPLTVQQIKNRSVTGSD